MKWNWGKLVIRRPVLLDTKISCGSLFGVGSREGSKAFEKALLPTHCFFSGWWTLWFGCSAALLEITQWDTSQGHPDFLWHSSYAYTTCKKSVKNKLALGKRAGLARVACSQSSSATISCHLWVIHYCWVPLLLLLLVSVCWTPVAWRQFHLLRVSEEPGAARILVARWGSLCWWHERSRTALLFYPFAFPGSQTNECNVMALCFLQHIKCVWDKVTWLPWKNDTV